MIKRCLLLLTIFIPGMAAHTLAKPLEEQGDGIDFSGFARFVGGYLNEENAAYLGYEDRLSFDNQSLLGLRADAKLNEEFSAVGQLLGHTADNRDSGIEWLYLKYQPQRFLQFKLGRQRTPFYYYSDVIDVGFAYPWINPPQQVYNGYPFYIYDGISGTYDFTGSNFALALEGYWGQFDDTYSPADFDAEATADDLRGVIVNLRIAEIELRASYHTADAEVVVPDLINFSNELRQLGFKRSADTLHINGKADFFQFSASYEKLDYFLIFEWTQIDSAVLLVPRLRNFYLTAGFNYYPYTFFLTYGHNETKYDDPVLEIPIGVSPQLDELAVAYQMTFDSLPVDDLSSYAIGIRWDWRTNIAFKSEITHLIGKNDQRSFFRITDDDAFDREATLFQVAAEWVF